jgi:hypothetical protein
MVWTWPTKMFTFRQQGFSFFEALPMEFLFKFVV